MERLRTRPMYVLSCVSFYAVLTALQVEFDPGCEAMIYTTDGTPLQGHCFFALTRDFSAEIIA